jgi:putative spermidine/putrescine transport system ATP-binding protein
MAHVELKGLAKAFGSVTAVDAIDLAIDDGELVCLLGPSGSGKSTVLRMIGGFERPTSGSISIDRVDVTRVPPERRPTAMVFQSHALWSHMSVFGNIAFGLKLRRLARDEIRKKVEAVLDLVGLAGYATRLPGQLSGGQQQRVALARSLVIEPKILLLDEPFASLDQHLRERLREEVRDIQQRLGITAIFVTHGQDEALAVSDRIVVMNEGRMQQAGRPSEIYRFPQTPFVAGFIGSMNLIDGTVENGTFALPGLLSRVPVEDGPGTLAFRPEDVGLSEPVNGEAGLKVHRIIDFGSHAVVELDLAGGKRVKAQVKSADGLQPGQPVGLTARRIAFYRDNRVLHRSD